MHHYDSYPAGRITEIRKEGSQLVGEVEFDMEDEFAARIANKYKNGFMNGFSISVKPIEKSKDISLLLEGQKRATISKSELYEISCVTIPSHEDAIVIRTTNKEKENELLRSVFYQNQHLETKQEPVMDLEKLAKRLSLSTTGKEKPTEEGINAAIDAILERATNAEKQVTDLQKVTTEKDKTVITLEERLANLEEAQKTEKVDLLIRGAVESQKITSQEGENYKKLALVDYDSVADLLKEKKAYRSITSQLQTVQSTGKQSQFEALKTERSAWKFSDWQKKDSEGLAYARENDKEFYNSILPKN
jgi:HK97 family phage prohead protease